IGRADGRGPFEGCLRGSAPSNKLHPTEKPVAILRELVRAVPPGGVVLDPFAGSGSTLVAAVSEGYRAIGIEREPEYCEIIRQRMEAAGESEDDVEQTELPLGVQVCQS